MKIATIKRIIKIFISPILRIGLKNRNFSIISNNCWAGHYYDMFRLKYLTPTIGLFIPPKDYLKLIGNLKYYMDLELINVKPKDAKCYEILKRKEEKNWISSADNLIIGKLDDVEIVFLHYDSFEIAKEKWDRRKKRINYDCIVYKFNDQNECSAEDVYDFFNLNIENKIFFTSNDKYKKFPNSYFIKRYENKYGFVFDDLHNNGFKFKKYFNELMK